MAADISRLNEALGDPSALCADLYALGGAAIWVGVTHGDPRSLNLGQEAMARVAADEYAQQKRVHDYHGARAHQAYDPLYQQRAAGEEVIAREPLAETRHNIGGLLGQLLKEYSANADRRHLSHAVRNTGRLLLLRSTAAIGLVPIPAPPEAQSADWLYRGTHYPQLDTVIMGPGGIALPCEMRLVSRGSGEQRHPGVHYVDLGSTLVDVARSHPDAQPATPGRSFREILQATTLAMANVVASEATGQAVDASQTDYLAAATASLVVGVGRTLERQRAL